MSGPGWSERLAPGLRAPLGSSRHASSQVGCGTPGHAVSNSWVQLQISSWALFPQPGAHPHSLQRPGGGRVMAEKRFLLAQPPLPFLPQQWRKRSPESVAVPGPRTHLAPGRQCQQPQGQCTRSPSLGARSACCWEHPISAAPVAQPSGSPVLCLRPRGSSVAFPGAGGQPARHLPREAVWTVGGLQVQSSTPLREISLCLPCPTGPQLSLLGDVCTALGCALADSRL